MLVGDIISNNVITLTVDDDVKKAFEVMKANNIRHIPVLDGQELVGIVTNTDLRHVLIPSRSEGSENVYYFTSKFSTVEEIMTKTPIIISPQADVEEAAALLQHYKIGGLPVVQDNELVGMITETDILGVFVEIMGVIKYSSRVEVSLGEDAEAFQNVSQIIRENGAEIISVGMSPLEEQKKRVYYFRLDTDDINSIAESLKDNGYDVVSATSA
ncbi:MAG: CBS and ACT domain-containing protein [Thermodesulfobacteriota bacterium]|nr:CBS and ACT domain-containing protein [Thermodesulfobacteriota bacterium]